MVVPTPSSCQTLLHIYFHAMPAQVDNLRTNKRGTYVLKDANFGWLRRLSAVRGDPHVRILSSHTQWGPWKSPSFVECLVWAKAMQGCEPQPHYATPIRHRNHATRLLFLPLLMSHSGRTVNSFGQLIHLLMGAESGLKNARIDFQ